MRASAYRAALAPPAAIVNTADEVQVDIFVVELGIGVGLFARYFLELSGAVPAAQEGLLRPAHACTSPPVGTNDTRRAAARRTWVTIPT
jgi:hypothetical protein